MFVGYLPSDFGKNLVVLSVRGNHEERCRVDLRNRNVRLNPSGIVQPLRVRDDSAVAVDVGGRHPIEQRAGVPPLDEEFAHERHVEQSDAASTRVVLLLPIREPALPLERHSFNDGGTMGRIPRRALPPRDVAKVCVHLRETIMHRGPSTPPTRFGLFIGIVGGVGIAQRLSHALRPVLRIVLISMKTRCVHGRGVNIRRRRAIAYPPR